MKRLHKKEKDCCLFLTTTLLSCFEYYQVNLIPNGSDASNGCSVR